MLIFEQSKKGRKSFTHICDSDDGVLSEIPSELLRKTPLELPEVSELQVVRHYTVLSQKNFSIDTHFYPLGSCTMKYNPRIANTLSMLPGFIDRHPCCPDENGQGLLNCMYYLQESLANITGMSSISLTPAAGAQGELAGVAMIKAFHESNGDCGRTEFLIPDAAHGTNPATAVMCGYSVKEIPTGKDGDLDIEALKAAVGSQTAGIMLTNPSTLGVFERKIKQIAEIIHGVGGLLYYDGANLNAILGKVSPGNMGFDAIHINLHKTFSTPHGGGGPGAGAVGVSARLKPFLPIPIVDIQNGEYSLRDENDNPMSIGHLSAFMGNIGILLRAYVYVRMLGEDGLERIADFSVLNANYMLKRLEMEGFEIAFPKRRASHEFIITLKKEAKEFGLTAAVFAKNLLDYGFHAPTTYFPMLISECFLIEPTETESKQEIDLFIDAMCDIRSRAVNGDDRILSAPHKMPVARLDDVKAARELNLVYLQ